MRLNRKPSCCMQHAARAFATHLPACRYQRGYLHFSGVLHRLQLWCSTECSCLQACSGRSQADVGDIRCVRRGDPVHNETQAAYILAYSPLDNVRPQAYPHMLASGGARVSEPCSPAVTCPDVTLLGVISASMLYRRSIIALVQPCYEIGCLQDRALMCKAWVATFCRDLGQLPGRAPTLSENWGGRLQVLTQLAWAGLHDTRVPYWAASKWAAATRAAASNAPLVLLQTNLGAGHAGPSGFSSGHRETALRHAWLLRMTCWGGSGSRVSGAPARGPVGGSAGFGAALLWLLALAAAAAAGLGLWRWRARRRASQEGAGSMLQMQAVGAGRLDRSDTETERLFAPGLR